MEANINNQQVNPDSAQPDGQPSLPPVSNKKKFILPGLILLGVLIIGLVVAFYLGRKTIIPPSAKSSGISSAPVITSNNDVSWRTYTSPQFGFSFNYPLTYNSCSFCSVSTPDEAIKILTLVDLNTVRYQTDTPHEGIDVYEYFHGNPDFRSFVQEEKIRLSGGQGCNEGGSIESLNINGKEAYILKGVCEKRIDALILVKKEGKNQVLGIVGTEYEDAKESFEPLFKQIVSSFKFK